MSDLDADLYGDLYGNDEVDLDPTHDDTEALHSAEQPAEESPAPSAPTPEVSSKPATTTTSTTTTNTTTATEKPYANGTGASSSAPANGTANQPAFNAPVLQKIPTYEQPQPSDYHSDAPSRGDGAYQHIPVTERSIRPSEMKDEGHLLWGHLVIGLVMMMVPLPVASVEDSCVVSRSSKLALAYRYPLLGLGYATPHVDMVHSRVLPLLSSVKSHTVYVTDTNSNLFILLYHVAYLPQITSVQSSLRLATQTSKFYSKMFIGGLNWDTTDETLREYFSQFGKVDACTIMRDAAGRSRCFAFLTFEDPASVNAVMVREHYLDGKVIDPKRAIPRQEHQRATKLFIGGLAGSVTSESMREFFSQFGKVIDSTVMLDRETGRSKGFGFVSFEDTNVQPFLGFGNLEIDGKLIDVKLAQPRYQRDNFSGEEGGAGGSSGGEFAQGAATGAGQAAPRTFNAQQGNFTNPIAAAAGMGSGNTPFDPQQLAALYTRMFQMTSGGMNPAMMGGMGGGMGAGGMNPMMAAGMGNFGGGMRPGMGMGMGGMGGMGGAGGMGGMGRGGGQGMMGGGGGMNPNIPRGPRGAPGGMSGAGVGPQRSQRGGHNFHPYAR
ncbi:hypothetical protein CVT24_007162 [Panaeolus cyanescens]|uniref:RRM domain-containing protein n=1 Tax=Panaeolus cyanescens TaxID=181874 RepID=A0A409YPI4_9AGAR|nr:hypothetical protein CVT24_007162 [Panaeolus cyanescens]